MPELNPKIHYLDKLCSCGHEYLDSGKSLRYIKNRYCVRCRIIIANKYRLTPKAQKRIIKYRNRKDVKKTAKKYHKKYYKENREECLEITRIRNKKYREENKDKIRKSRIKNREKHRKTEKAYREKKRGKIHLYNKNYYKENCEKAKLWRKRYCQENPEKVRLSNRKYREKNLKKICKKSRLHHKKYCKELRDCYVRDTLRRMGMIASDIMPETIELKRMQLKFHREIKKGKEALNEIYQNV